MEIMKRCLFCGKAEHCFKKTSKGRTYEGAEVLLKAHNEFWFCQNVDCLFYIHIELFVFKHMVWDNVDFYWREDNITELNLEAVRKFNRKNAILNGYGRI